MNLFTRLFRMATAATALALSLVPSTGHAEAGAKTLRFIPQADLRSIDPIWTTAYVTRNFGYLVFDTLFSLDKDFKPQPAPDYVVNVLAPAEKPGAPRKVIKSMTVKPQAKWFREKPNDLVPTLEITLK